MNIIGLLNIATIATRCRILLADGVVLALFLASQAFAADKPLPEALKSYKDGSGEVIIGRYPDVHTAKAALKQVLTDMAGQFDSQPKADMAVGDNDDHALQALIVARRSKTDYLGVAHVIATDKGAVVAIMYDKADAFDKSRTNLANLLKKNMPDETPAKFTKVRLPDDTGSVDVPDPKTWTVQSQKNMVDIDGPEGSVKLHMWLPVATPQYLAEVKRHNAQMALIAAQSGLPAPPPMKIALPVVAYGKVWDSFSQTMVQSFAMAGIEVKNMKLIEEAKQPSPMPGGQAAYLLYEADVKSDGKSVKYRALAYVAMAPSVDLTWTCYFSYAGAKADDFDKNLPTLLRIWTSDQTDQKVFQERWKKAQESMKETSRIIREAYDYRSLIQARACDDWSEAIRGTQIVHDNQADLLHTVTSYKAEDLVEALNRHEGYERYRIIPLKDINDPLPTGR